jgi:hypothetical protein
MKAGIGCVAVLMGAMVADVAALANNSSLAPLTGGERNGAPSPCCSGGEPRWRIRAANDADHAIQPEWRIAA